MSSELVNPNLHVVLIHYPLGLLVLGVLIELFAPILWRRSAFRLAGRWMIALGALSMIPSTTTGLYALVDVAQEPMPAEQAEFLERHGWSMFFATFMAVIPVFLWIAASNRWRRRLHWPVMIVLLGAVASVIIGSWYAGEAVYRHGTGVERVGGDQEREELATPSTQPLGAPRILVRAEAAVRYVVPPLQGHLLLSGAAIAVGVAALALSIRQVTSAGEMEREARRANANEPLGASGDPSDPLALLKSINPTSHIVPGGETLPAARFWVLAIVLAAVATIAGWWFLAVDSDAWTSASQWRSLPRKAPLLDRIDAVVRYLKHLVFDVPPDERRRMYHVINGGIVIGSMLLLAILARWGRRQRILLVLVASVFLASTTFQTWLGVLLTLEGPAGSVTAFNDRDALPPQVQTPEVEQPAPPVEPATQP